MFENLSERLERSFKILKGEGKITELNVAATMKDIRKALMEADVSYNVAKTFTNEVKEKAIGMNVLTAVKPGQLLVKLVHDEMAVLMGGETVGLNLTGKPAIILMSGLQGSGKTTFSSPAPENGSYEAAVREILAKDKKAGLQYWKDLLDGYENRAEIPSYGELSEDEMSPEDELILTLPVELSAKLAKLCTEEQATVNNAVELLWGLILSVYSRSHDAVFAKVVSGRDNTKT